MISFMKATRITCNCQIEIQAERGVVYVHGPNGITLIRISGLTAEQCQQNQIDVRAEQPRSHDETMGKQL